MSIGLLKRLLSLTKLFAFLVILGAGWGYFDHRSAMGGTWAPADFRPEVAAVAIGDTDIRGLQMQLGRFQRERAVEVKQEEKVPEEQFESLIKRLGEIKSAIAAYPPYRESWPSILFEYHQAPANKEKTRVLGLGEALVERENPDDPLHPVPLKYQFVACERDPQSGYALFVFDMNCDGKDLQKLRWKLEDQKGPKLQRTTEGAPEGITPIRDPKMYVGRGPGSRAPAPPPEQRPDPELAVPVAPPPPSVTATPDEPETLFEEEDGAFATTREGAEYLRNNYQKVLEGTRTQTYRDRGGQAKGIRILGIREASVANQFGILKDDVILSINGQRVTDQAEAVNVVKAELKKNVRYVTVRILRRGREIDKKFDTRDPDTRRMARNLR